MHFGPDTLFALYLGAAIATPFVALLVLRHRHRAALGRERAIPAGTRQLNPELWDGKAALERAEAAAQDAPALAAPIDPMGRRA